MEICRCQAIVLGVTDYRESDKIVTLFTLEHGKLNGVARGAKRSMRRFGGALEPFALLTVQLALARGLAFTGGLVRLDGVDLVTIHPGIRKDLLKIAYAGYASEATDLLLPEGMANPRLFRLLYSYLEWLDTVPAAASDRRFFEINLLNILGYRPALDECAGCGSNFSLSRVKCRAGPAGDLFCERCGRAGLPITAGTIARLKTALRSGRFGSVAFVPEELAEAGAILDPAIAGHVRRPLKSLAFLSEMGG